LIYDSGELSGSPKSPAARPRFAAGQAWTKGFFTFFELLSFPKNSSFGKAAIFKYFFT
jgi:hypothetical protein